MTLPVMPPAIERIQRRVAAVYGLRLVDILSRRQERRVARPRQVAMYLARRLTPLTLAEIGDCFRRDHTTVMSAVRSIEADLDSRPDMRARVERLEAELRESATAQAVVDDAGAAAVAELRQVANKAIARDPRGAVAAIIAALRPLAGALVLVLPPGAADAQVMVPWPAVCDERGALHELFRRGAGEATVATALTAAGNLVERLEGPTGSWSILVTDERGVSCVISTGTDWQERQAEGGGM